MKLKTKFTKEIEMEVELPYHFREGSRVTRISEINSKQKSTSIFHLMDYASLIINDNVGGYVETDHDPITADEFAESLDLLIEKITKLAEDLRQERINQTTKN